MHPREGDTCLGAAEVWYPERDGRWHPRPTAENGSESIVGLRGARLMRAADVARSVSSETSQSWRGRGGEPERGGVLS